VISVHSLVQKEIHNDKSRSFAAQAHRRSKPKPEGPYLIPAGERTDTGCGEHPGAWWNWHTQRSLKPPPREGLRVRLPPPPPFPSAGDSSTDRLRSHHFLCHRAAAAWRAISMRFSLDNFSARARPPSLPPCLANSTAGLSGFGSASLASPTERSTISLPSWLGSRGRFGRLTMPLL
jgi:hypothetical protein